MAGSSPTDALALVNDATTRYLHTVDGLDEESLREPSVLPGWSRAHVVAHVSLNAVGAARALAGLARGQEVPVYASAEARDAEIEESASGSASEIREQALASSGEWRETTSALAPAIWSGQILRVPGVAPWANADVVGMRHREVEIHHADLGLGYGPREWPTDFTLALLEMLQYDRAEGPSMVLRATDLAHPESDPTGAPGPWTLGAGAGPTVTGGVGDLAWWLLGRGEGAGLECIDGDLPRIGPWQRRTPAR